MVFYKIYSLMLAYQVVSVATSLTGTNFLDNSRILANVEDPAWFVENVPIVDLPDQQIQEVYYYRWQSWREHLSYTGPQYSWLSTEFLGAVGYAGPYGAISAAAGHHVREGRWLRDRSYGQDLINFWLAGPGIWPKPANDDVNADTYTWGTEYSFWVASAVWWHYLVTGDVEFTINQLDNLKAQYDRWSNHYNATLGLYWQVPVWDATEFTLASYASSDPYHGGAGYRPTINAYQYGDAMAIANIAQLAGDSDTVVDYAARADSLKTNLQNRLWNKDQQFFEHVARDNNPQDALLGAREIMGYLPWMFDMPDSSNTDYSAAFAQLQDTAGFSSPFGPLTGENRSTNFMKDAYAGCCRWDGPSWPFATSQTLIAAENLLHNYPGTMAFTAADYQVLIKKYAATQYRNGVPYIAEAHDPYADNWLYDGYNHSEDYNHSTYVDNIIAGLLGLRPQTDTTLVINPLVPTSWDNWAVENAPYHGHSITVIWDSDGSHYGQGSGFKVFVDGTQKIARTTIGKVTIDVGSVSLAPISNLVNIAANPLSFEQATRASASFDSDNAKRANDGSIYRLDIPENSRWSSAGSTSTSDWIALDLRQLQALDKVVLYFYDDGGSTKIPSEYDLQYNTNGTWTTIPGQERSTAEPTNHAPVTITFPKLSTAQIRVLASNGASNIGWGLSEFQVWTAPIFLISNVNSGKVMTTTSDGSLVQQSPNTTSNIHLWEFQSLKCGWKKIKNLASGQVLASDGTSPNLITTADTGNTTQQWRVEDNGQVGQFLIINRASGLVAGVADNSTADGAVIGGYANDGGSGELWELLPSIPL